MRTLQPSRVIPGALMVLFLAPLTGCFTWQVQESSFFHPMPTEAAADRVEIRRDDGTLLVGRFVEHPRARATLVYFGGNRECVARSGETLEKLSGFGLNVLMVDYRGYGASEGSPSLETFFEDALAVLRHAANRPDAKDLPLLAYGFSLGGFAAAHAAAEERCDGLVLEATGTDVQSWIRLVVPWYRKPFVRIHVDGRLQRIDNAQEVRKFRGPLLVMGGKADQEAPAAMSRRLFEASPSPKKTLHLFPRGIHGSIRKEAEFDRVFAAFLREAGVLKDSSTASAGSP